MAALVFPQVSAAQTTGEFLGWDREAQDSFFQVSLVMLQTVATQISPEFSNCLGGWYFSGDANHEELHSEFLDVMADYREFSPSAFVLGYVEARCGKLGT